jgi:hypothetical protein
MLSENGIQIRVLQELFLDLYNDDLRVALEAAARDFGRNGQRRAFTPAVILFYQTARDE